MSWGLLKEMRRTNFSNLKIVCQLWTETALTNCDEKISWKNLSLTSFHQVSNGLLEPKYSRIDQVKFFEGCLPKILLGPFLNTLCHLLAESHYFPKTLHHRCLTDVWFGFFCNNIWDRLIKSISRPYPFKFFKGCLPQILLGPFLNTLSH